jgi:valyl-tRNA synthetase
MIFSGMEFMKEIPFSKVIIHPTVLTKEGKRMSKSLGTGIDPVNLCEKYGADATRFGISWQLMGGQDIHFVEDNIAMGRKFCNKIWNASRFVLMQIGNLKFEIKNLKLKTGVLTVADKKILDNLNKTIKATDKNLEDFQFGAAARRLYDFFWHDFCDIYIEKAKDQKNENTTQKILVYVLLSSLKLLHPFIPFVTEEIYQKLPLKDKKKFLMIEDWPK